jgi:Carboxypeptidase regulatory-like domain/TonB dependent receptor
MERKGGKRAKRIVHLVCGISLLMTFVCANVWGQATASIGGTVSDATGARIPGVEVAVTQTDTGVSRTTVTNETGTYVLPTLPIGPYRLEAMLPGFRTFVQTGVLQVNDQVAINVALEVGQVAERVEVSASAALVETRNVGVGQLIENERILELPLNGRSVTELITLTGGAVQTSTARFNTGGSNQPMVSVGGGVGFGTGYTLDGASHLNYINASAMPVPFPDAVQEFNVETSGLSAKNANGSAVNMVTKSGTNEFHGNLFEFVRNDLFNARQYFSPTNSTLKRNQFGGTIGGPIVPSRLFFFGGYQGTLLRQDPASSRAFVPTPAMLQGDWTAYAGCTGLNLNRGGFVNNRIDPSRYARPALEIVKRINLTPENPCGEVFFNSRSISDEHQYVGRVDYQMSNKHSLFGRFVINKFNQPHAGAANPGQSILADNGNGYDMLLHSYAIGSTYLISPKAVQQFRVSVNRVADNLTSAKGFSFCEIGVKMSCTPNSWTDVQGAFQLGTRLPQGDLWRATTYGMSDDVSLLLGSHEMAFGFQGSQGRQFEDAHFFGVGWMQFRGFATGSPMADFLTGQVSLFYMAGKINQSPRQTKVALYATDSWSVTPRFTLNYGLRWEPDLPPSMQNGRIYSFDYGRFQQGTRSTVFRNAPPGLYYPGDPGFIGLTAAEKKWSRVAPRVGFAWDVNGDGRTSFRASYARNYEVLSGIWKEDWVAAAPWGNLTVIPSVPMTDPWSTTPGGDPFPLNLGVDANFNPGGSYQVHHSDVDTPRTDSWNVNLQRQFGQRWTVSASYLGNHSSKLWAQEMINPAVYIPGVGDANGKCFRNGAAVPFTVSPGTPCSTTGNTQNRRRFYLERPQDGGSLGSVTTINTDADTQYHGMLLSLQRRVGDLVLSGNYTWSRCIGDFSDLNSGGPATDETLTNPADPKFDRGNCDSDRRHVVNWTTVATMPQFAKRTARMLASGWRLSGIYRISSGAPLTVISGQDNALVGTNNQRANQVLASPYGDQSGRPGTNFLNRSAFAVPAAGAFGNVGRNSLRGLKSWSFDLSLSRVFRLTESQRIEVRAEAYNLTNSFRPVDPTTSTGSPGRIVSLTSGTFGVIRDSMDPRILQFAMKYFF